MIDEKQLLTTIGAGGIIAYPTESVYGLGCDPFNQQAVKRLLTLKQRDVAQGLILIGASWDQLKSLALDIPANRLAAIMKTWPGAMTWAFPASALVPAWIKGQHNTVALRVTNHPIAKQLCQLWDGPLVSTSANLHGHTPANNYQQAVQQFANDIDMIIEGKTGKLDTVTPIFDALTNQQLRS